MFTLLSRSILFTGVLVAGLSATAWSADTNAIRPKAIGPEPPVSMATASPADPGAVDEPSAVGATAQRTVEVAQSQPTRAHGTLTAGKRYASNRARIGYFRPVHRYSLMLGIGY
ncbi:MAG TPA: hypothetical protein VH519_00300 [Hyphomicrobiaceae bacterium]|jgi:hypothetical protein